MTITLVVLCLLLVVVIGVAIAAVWQFLKMKEALLAKEREALKAEFAQIAYQHMTKATDAMGVHVAALENFADQARSFTAALVGGNKIQGNKGEEILANILEKSGLKRGESYEAQLGEQTGVPDVSLYDPINKRVILLDAKMNIKDYIAAYNLPDDSAHKAERTRLLKSHVEAIKRQITGLAERNYPEMIPPSREGYENLPLVAMFCPFDAVLESALSIDPTLVEFAYEKGVVLVTPLTLWGYLGLVKTGWRRYQSAKNIEEIQKLGSDVLKALESLVGDLNQLGSALAKTQEAFASLQNRVTAEKGVVSVSRVAMLLRDYGCEVQSKTRKAR